MWWCQFINWIKFATRPSPLLDFKVANGVSLQLSFKCMTSGRVLDFLCKRIQSQVFIPQKTTYKS